MKKTLFLLLTSSLLCAQNSELFTNDWYLSKIETNGQTVATPTMDIALSKSNFVTVTGSGSGYALNSKHFNSCQIETTFVSNTNSFTKVNSACTLSMYGGNNMTAVNGYDQKHTDFFIYPTPGTIFNYEIIPNGSGKTLIITNPSTGNKLYYNNDNLFLSTKENGTSYRSLTFQNPVKSELFIENIENDLSVKVFNMLGEIVYEGKTNDRKVKIDTKNFAVGSYILNIQKYKSYKFIKE
ncbi:T9SS type A sorting domain-containing protein [Chryseobacterium sp. MMS23-Vi53]|uniref:T9SS type A sorting domain-containing protein n=1 Tax=Chryseobacterium sp. MMS23-Vi53 TaxID=3386644 RepID=UPI0039EC0F9C